MSYRALYTSVTLSLFVVALAMMGCEGQMENVDGFGNGSDLPAGASPSQNIDPNSRRPINESPGTNTGTQGGTTDRDTETVVGGGDLECGAAMCSGAQSCVDGICVNDGDLRISLVWESVLDLDLHVRTPSGEELYYRKRNGAHGGEFLKDGCLTDRCESEGGPFIETVLWLEEAPHGQYEFWAVNYDGSESADFRIEVLMGGEIKDVFRGSVAAQRLGSSDHYVACIGEDLNDENCEVQAPAADCYEELERLGVSFERWNYSTQSAGGKSCPVENPVRVASPINGVSYRYYNQSSSSPMSMSCELAVKLHKFGNILTSKGITDALHVGTFNCRTVAGSSSLSNHSFGKAIDLWAFEGNGTRYSLEDHWEHETNNPSTAKGKVLYNIAHEAHDQQIFNTILTPNYNAAHDNHFHIDLKASGGNYLGLFVPTYYLGDHGHEEVCNGHPELDEVE